MMLTVHRWFANKACPGDWLFSRLGELADAVNDRLRPDPSGLYRVQAGAFRSMKNAQKQVEALKAAGFDAVVIYT